MHSVRFEVAGPGMGNVTRCGALRDELLRRGWEVSADPTWTVYDGVEPQDGKKVVIEDFHRLHDGVVVHAPCRDFGTLAGPEYVLIRPEFRPTPRTFGWNPRIWRCFGGGPIPRIWEQMAEADLAIGAGGVMLWERCAMGLPSIVMSVAEDQVEQSKLAHEIGAVIYLGPSDTVSQAEIAAAVASVTPRLLRRMSQLGIDLVDGKGCQRVAEAMECLS